MDLKVTAFLFSVLFVGLLVGLVNAFPQPVLGTNPVENYNDTDGVIVFDFKCVDDIALDRIELWGNWTGVWALNYSFDGYPNDTWFNITVVDIPLGENYSWAVWCNSTRSEENVTSNRTFNELLNETICGESVYPECNGACDPGEACTVGEGYCYCAPEPEECYLSAWPACGGYCDEGQYCEIGEQICYCALIDPSPSPSPSPSPTAFPTPVASCDGVCGFRADIWFHFFLFAIAVILIAFGFYTGNKLLVLMGATVLLLMTLLVLGSGIEMQAGNTIITKTQNTFTGDDILNATLCYNSTSWNYDYNTSDATFNLTGLTLNGVCGIVNTTVNTLTQQDAKWIRLPRVYEMAVVFVLILLVFYLLYEVFISERSERKFQ